jgi:GH24 family phage-related lysozyme (muramidase)
MKKKVRPDVVAGGSAIDLGDNFYLMKGRTHKQGGIDIGKNPRTGIEVENNEVVQVTPNNVRVFSAQPILNGISPAEALLNGGNPRHIFNAQETWKQVNRVTDDGRKFGPGGYTPSKEIIDYIKKTEAFRDKWYKDGNGIDTIGYGFTGSQVKKLFPNGITREQADKYFADSIAKRAVILARDTPNWDILSQNQRDALLSYHYNIGEGSYRNKHKNLQKALTEKDWETAILNIDAGYNDKKNPGLRKRRDYERALFRSGSTSSLTGDEEKQFRDWYDRYSRSHKLNPNPDVKEHYYDYRGYWKNRTPEQANIEWQLDSHLPDTYKLPGHPTFSTQSRYSNKKTPGGTWKKVGLGPIYDEQFVDSKYTKRLKTFQNASYKMGGIYIKPSKRGTFRAAAKKHHMGVQEFARKVLNNRAQFSAAMIKKANFARNASKWHKKEFGGDMTKQFYITPNNIYKLGGNVRPKALLGKQTDEYERYYDNNGKTYYRIGNSSYDKDSFARKTGMTFDEIDAYFDAIESQGTYRQDAAYAFADPTGHIIPSIITADRQAKQPARPVGYHTTTIGFNDQLTGAPSVSLDKEQPSLPEKQVYKPIRITGSDITDAKFNVTGNGNVVPTTRFNINDIVGSNSGAKTPIQSIQMPPVQFKINTTGRSTVQSAGFAQIRPYDGRTIETNSVVTTPTTQRQRRNNNSPTRSSSPVVPELPIDYDVINKQIDDSNNRILSQTLNSDILTPIIGKSIIPAGVTTKQGIVGSTRAVPKNPYYSKFNVGLHKVGRFINDNPDLLGLGINWTGNAIASLINRSAIKGMRYPDAPIPLRAEKLPTEVNVRPQVSEIKENIAGQERLIKDNTVSSAVALARRQRVRNAGYRQFQTLMGDKANTELQLLTADKLNRQGVDNQNITGYNRWREGLYDFNNKKREMFAENAVAGINNAAEAFAGPEGYLARKEGRNRDILNAGLIAATSPNAQKVIGSKEFAEFLRKLGYKGTFSLLDKRFNG